jgi:catechol 2,3-dioxygenase-like lactoylglutathione lyase family enzyme
MIKKLSMVTRFVADQDAAVEFYTDKLGFEIRMDHPGPHGRFLTVAPETDTSAELVLMTPDGFDNEEAERLSTLIGNDGGLIYEVDGFQKTYRTLRENGVQFLSQPETMPWGIQAVALDQDGNEIIIQERSAVAET